MLKNATRSILLSLQRISFDLTVPRYGTKMLASLVPITFHPIAEADVAELLRFETENRLTR